MCRNGQYTERGIKEIGACRRTSSRTPSSGSPTM
jgi:hypothetical protein